MQDREEIVMQTLGEVLEASKHLYPQRIAVEREGERLTYDQLFSQVLYAARQLEAMQLTTESVVALLFQNTPTALVSFLALAWLGIGTIPLDPNLPVHELETIQQQIDFRTIIGDQASLTKLQPVFTRCNLINSDTLLPTGDASSMGPPTEPVRNAEATFLYHFTSGSTGVPKAALHSQENLVNGATIYQQTYHVTSEDTLFVPIPLYHSFGMIAGFITSLLCGARLVLNSRFIPTQIASIIGEQQVTLFLATPMIYDLVARCALRTMPDTQALRYCLSSGSTLSPETEKKFSARFGRAVYSVYGCTEVGIIASRWGEGFDWPEQATGHPVVGVQARIVDDQGRDVPAGNEGALLVKTPAMFRGYYEHAEATQRAFLDGWYVTGDLARQDKQGYLYLIGRKDTFINVGGKKVNPAEVESVLLAHPKVKEAIVFGRQIPNMGESVHAAVVLHEDIANDELIAFCRQHLTSYKVPAHIHVYQEFARTSLGKIRRAHYTNAEEHTSISRA
jgi:long-chain acyl-CoA synthetase